MAEAVKEAAEKKKKGSFGKLLLLVINSLLFVAGLGFFLLTKFGILGPSTNNSTVTGENANAQQQVSAQQQTMTTEPPLSHEEGMGQETLTVAVEPFVVNLSDKNGRRFLNLVMQVEVSGERNKEEVEKRLPHIRNRLIFLLSSKRYADISSADGKYELQDEIRHHVNDVLGAPLVKRVLFTRLVVQ